MNALSTDDSELAILASTRPLEEPPPAYKDLSLPISISTDYTDATLTGDAQPTLSHPFPLSFNLYYKKTKWKTTTLHIGEHAGQPCNIILLNSGWKGTTLMLHQSIDKDSAVVASATSDSAWNRNSSITLPAVPNSDDGELVEKLEFHAGLASIRYNFSIDVPKLGAKPRVENFEWRITHGKEIHDLDKHNWGWKLVRLDKTSGSIKSGGKRKERTVGETSDGKEVVALWADNTKASRNKMGTFQFIGSGANGELGRQWAIMAVTTI